MRRPGVCRQASSLPPPRPNAVLREDQCCHFVTLPGVDDPFAGLRPGAVLDPLTLTISVAANDRYWQGAGIDHPLRRSGALYPLIATNLTVLTFQQHCPAAMIQTHQHLVCHRRGDAPAQLETVAEVVDLWDRRGLPYLSVRATITCDGAELWTSTVHFTPAARLSARA
jgi:hypothetical protein